MNVSDPLAIVGSDDSSQVAPQQPLKQPTPQQPLPLSGVQTNAQGAGYMPSGLLSGALGGTPTASAQPAAPPSTPQAPSAQPAIPPASTNDPMAFSSPTAPGPTQGPYSGSPLYAPGGAFAGQGYNGANTLAGLSAPSGGASDLPASPPPTSQTPTAQPAGPTSTPATPTSGLPPGFTLGSAGGANWGTAYYNGQQVQGLGANGIELQGGTIIPNTNAQEFQQLENAENANYESPAGQIGQMQRTAQNPNTLPSISAVLGNNEYQNLVANNPGVDISKIYGQMSPQLQQLFQQSPIYGGAYGDLQANGLQNLPTPTAMPQNGTFPGLPSTQSGSTAAPTSASSNLTTYNPLQVFPPSGTSSASGTSGGSPATPSATGSDIGGFLSNIGGQAPTSTGSMGGGSSPGLGYSLSQTDPNNPLTNQTITPTNTNFMGQAQQLIAAQQAAEQPQFQADLRDANRYAAGNGQLYSGIENSSLGNIAQNFALGQNQQAQGELYNALGQQNANQYANIGIAQQQQGFQNEQQNEAFNQALQQLEAGSQGDPAQLEMVLSQIFGSQGSNAGNAAAQYMGNQQLLNSSALSNAQLQNYINSLYGNSGGFDTNPVSVSGTQPGAFNPNPGPLQGGSYLPYQTP